MPTPRSRLPRPSMRPSFRIPVPGDGCAALAQVHEGLKGPAAPFVGQVLKRHAYIQLPAARRSLLSPYLNLQLGEADGGGTVLLCRFSPHPAVWTGFMGVYGVFAMLAAAGLMYGWAQTTVDEYPWGLWVAPVCLALAAFVYGAAVIGQGLTAGEMHEMRCFVERAAERAGARIPAAGAAGEPTAEAAAGY
ncbi:MAG: hypothetical protein IH621_17710 [Krumholzibacteria bacterium]|nr:hypothetical protein [Candidatus Krumholzibacteria bacterium]